MALPDGVVATAAQYSRDASDFVIGFEFKPSFCGGAYPLWTLRFGGPLGSNHYSFSLGRHLSLGNTIGVIPTISDMTISGGDCDPAGQWHTVRFVNRFYGGDISVPTPPSYTTELYLDGSLASSATVNNGAPLLDPAVQVYVAMTLNLANLNDYYGAHTDDTWYTHAAMTEQCEIRNVFCSCNGVIRYYDSCTDGHVEFGNTSQTAAYHSPRVGETIGIYETADGLMIEPIACGYYTDTVGSSLMSAYWPLTAYGCDAYGGGTKRAHRMAHCVSGAEMRGLLHPEWTSDAAANYLLPLFWPHHELIRRADPGAGPYAFEVSTYGDDPRTDGTWVEPTRTELGNLHRARYLLDNPTATSGTLLEGIGVAPVTSDTDYTANDYLPTFPYGALVGATGTAPQPIYAYNAYDGDHDRTSWFTDGSTPDELCGQDGQGRPYGVGYEQQAGPINVRWNPTLCRDSCNDLEDQRDDVVASEDATLVLDPVSGELAFVAIQDAWASTDEGDYDVNLVTQRIGYEGGSGYVLETPGVVATLGAADLDEAFQLADATIDERGRLWVAVWRVASSGTAYGYSTMQALVYRADALGQAATLLSTVTVNRPPHNAAWLVFDRTADEAFLAMQDTGEAQGLVIVKLPMLAGETAITSYVTAGDGSLPTPPYGAFFAAGQAMPHRLLAVWIDEAGAWRARWAWAEWFNAYSTTNVVVQALAADTAEADYANWPNVYPDLTGDTRIVGIAPVFMEDVAENEADLHPLTGAATWSDRDLSALIQGAPA